MVRCPKCGEEIDYLSYDVASHSGGYFSLPDGFTQEYDANDYGDDEIGSFSCPECESHLFDGGGVEASKFLNKKKVKGEI